MKKFVAGLLVSAILFIPAGAFAWASQDIFPPRPQPIYQFNCFNPTNGIERVQCHNEVAVFDDQDNKCYLTYDRYGHHSAISCIKGNQ